MKYIETELNIGKYTQIKGPMSRAAIQAALQQSLHQD